MMELKHLGLALAATTVFFASAAQAQQNDRFTLRLGAMDADASSEVTARTRFMGQDFRYSQDFDFGSNEISPRIDGTFRFSERQRLVFDYFQYDKEKTTTLDGDLSFDDITIPAGSFARAEVEFTLASLMYDYAVVDTDQFELGLQIGAE